ncbi:MAG: hypothetical protein QOH03_5541, partial [Kribbellaceae bacterium]|nr:hypothetical protein [Kribbellaceae bacterium]
MGADPADGSGPSGGSGASGDSGPSRDSDRSGRLGRLGRSGPWRALIAAALALILVAAGGAIAFRQRDAPQPTYCRTHGSKPVTNGSPTAVVLGDSYTAGQGLTDRTQAWSTVLGRLEGWRTYAEAVSGTGLTNNGPCTKADYGSRLPQALAHHPQILVVQGGLNDTHAPPGADTDALTRLIDRSTT